MTIRKGEAWGTAAPLPADGAIVRSDAEARAVVTAARRASEPVPPIGLLGGDLCRTLGGRGDEGRLRSEDAMTFPIDLGEALLDGRLHFFVAHLAAHRGWWRGRAVVAMNAQWLGRWNLGPRAHPNDGLLDVYDARVPVSGVLKVRRRLHQGAHLPHPAIREQRRTAVQVTLDRAMPVRLDGDLVGSFTNLSLRVEADALTVVI